MKVSVKYFFDVCGRDIFAVSKGRRHNPHCVPHLLVFPSKIPRLDTALSILLDLITTAAQYVRQIHPPFMNFVEPVRSTKKIAQIKNLLKGQGRYRDLLLFTTGINTALRVSDLLSLRIGDFIAGDDQLRQRFWIREAKRNKRNDVIINDSITQALADYRAAYPAVETNATHYLFFNTKTNNYKAAINRKQAWKIITALCHDIGLQGNYGTHSLRKTWGYHARQNGVDLALIMYKLNHNSLAYTKRYLGITNEELEAISRRLNL